jgi:precorrin-6A/cobalt-precorrin-6A reductase
LPIPKQIASLNDAIKRLLILGGTGDAARLAAEAVKLPQLEVISTLAGRTTSPALVASTVRVGGFGGKAGLANYLHEMNIDLLIDATHPFAAQISENAAQAANEVGIPWLMLIRPFWEKLPEDDWIEVESISAAVEAIPARAERVFLTIGRQQLAPFARLQDRWFLIRSIDPPAPDLPLPPGRILLDRGPFILAQERQLLQDNRIQAIVSKNSGGDATYAKVIAAREMGIPIIMVQRPIAPLGDKVITVSGAIDWLRDRIAC